MNTNFINMIILYYKLKRFTCNELHIVKSHRKTVVLALTANIPIIHVTPSKGNSIIAPSIDDLIIHT